MTMNPGGVEMVKKCIAYRRGYSEYKFVCGKRGSEECSGLDSCGFRKDLLNYIYNDSKKNIYDGYSKIMDLLTSKR